MGSGGRLVTNSQENAGLSPATREDTVVERPLVLKWITDELIADTRRVWSPLYGRELTIEEAIDILVNVKRLAELLMKGAGNEHRDLGSRFIA